MKRLSHQEISKIIEFNEENVNTIVIENKKFFREFIFDLYSQINGNEGKIVLSNDYKPIAISKNIEIVCDYINFDINKKSLITKICSKIESVANNEENYLKTNQLISNIEKYFYDILSDTDYNIEFEKLSLGNITKALGIKINNEYENILEKLIDYMELVRELENDKIFVFINIKSYFEDELISMFIKTIINKKFNVLFIENCDYGKLDKEEKLIIDNDLCEIY